MINTICIATRGRPPPSICHMRVRRGSKTQAGRHGSLGGALGPRGRAWGEALGAGMVVRMVVRKVSAGWSYGTKTNAFFQPFATPKRSIPLRRGAHSV